MDKPREYVFQQWLQCILSWKNRTCHGTSSEIFIQAVREFTWEIPQISKMLSKSLFL